MPMIINAAAIIIAMIDVFLNRVGLLISLSLERMEKSGKEQDFSNDRRKQIVSH